MTKQQIKDSLKDIVEVISNKDKDILNEIEWLYSLEDGTNCKEQRVASCLSKSDAYDDCLILVKRLLMEME